MHPLFEARRPQILIDSAAVGCRRHVATVPKTVERWALAVQLIQRVGDTLIYNSRSKRWDGTSQCQKLYPVPNTLDINVHDIYISSPTMRTKTTSLFKTDINRNENPGHHFLTTDRCIGRTESSCRGMTDETKGFLTADRLSFPTVYVVVCDVELPFALVRRCARRRASSQHQGLALRL